MNQPIELQISGMTCGHCQKFVHETLAELTGVSDVSVDHKTGTAHLSIDTHLISEAQVRDAVNNTGVYHVVNG
ncbi:MAG: heavy-metal-associated domain-containing protein [Bacteroidia bacterium]